MKSKYLLSFFLILCLLVAGPAIAADEFDEYYHEHETSGHLEEEESPAVHTSLGDVGSGSLNQTRSIILNRLQNLLLARGPESIAVAGRVTESGPVLASLGGDSGLGLGVWVDGFGVSGDQDKDGVFLGYDYDTRGLSLGVDKTISDALIVGISAGQAESEVDYSGTFTEHEVDAVNMNIYAAWTSGQFYLDGALSYADSEYDSKRLTGGGLAISSHDGTDMAVCVNGGYVMPMGDLNLIPMLSLAYAQHDEDGFIETVGGAPSMQVFDFDTDSLLSKLGVRVNRVFQVGGMQLLGQARLQWAHEFEDTDREATARFLSPTGAAFTVKGVEPDPDSALYGLDMSLYLTQALSVNLSFDGEWRDKFEACGLAGGLRLVF